MRKPLRANALAQVTHRLRIAVKIRESHPTSIVDWGKLRGSAVSPKRRVKRCLVASGWATIHALTRFPIEARPD
jgi:hypothetical protein